MRNIQDLPSLTVEQILAWADAHHARTGLWPTKQDSAIADAPGERWHAVDVYLRQGLRGLPPGLSLARLLARPWLAAGSSVPYTRSASSFANAWACSR